MNAFNKTILSLLLLSFSFAACQDMLDVTSDRIVLDKENSMKSDSLYSMFGILSRLEKLANSYVVLGELRADLLEPTENANKYLWEIYNYSNCSKDNPYTNNLSSYYEVINNCNYVINNVDTAIVSKGEKVMYQVMAAAKSIRAWTYMQIALNYGKATYFDKALLSIVEASKEYPSKTFDELAPLLIEDLLPFKDEKRLRSLQQYIISIPFLLGDLYLWTGQYENAANMYRDLMFSDYDLITASYQSYRVVAGSGATMQFTGDINWNWGYTMWYGSSFTSVLASSNEVEPNYELNDLFLDRGTIYTQVFPTASLVPSEKTIVDFDSTLYFHDYYISGIETRALTTYGDLRKGIDISNSPTKRGGSMYSPSVSVTTQEGIKVRTQNYVAKYYWMNFNQYTPENYNKPETGADYVMIHRTGLLYLRYAEAVNRLGKPNLAMATLKNGLNRTTLANNRLVPPQEKSDPLPNYMNFNDFRFDYNVGVRSCGLGRNIGKDTTFFIIKVDKPEPTLQDSILYVEDLIQKELVLETAFEGNRFHDLMRLAIHRKDDSYLANIVASKFKDPATREAIRNKLSDRQNWYLK